MVIMEKNNIEYIEKGDVVHFKIIKSELKKINLDLFDLEETKKLWAFAIKFGSELIYFRKYTENKILDKKPLLALFVSDGAFNKLDKSVITIDQKVDCIYYKEKIYILNKNQFEQIFSFLEKLMDAGFKRAEVRSPGFDMPWGYSRPVLIAYREKASDNWLKSDPLQLRCASK